MMPISLLLAATLTIPSPALDTAIARMGGERALRAVTRVRFEMLTQWQRTSFTDAPYNDGPSYELHSDVRDYTIGAWRNSRRFPVGAAWRDITDIVRDTVAIRRMNAAWAPLNVAYVDERDEVFAFAPERVLLAARDASDRRTLSDTTMQGVSYARIAATIGRFPTTLYLRKRDGLLAIARFRAAQPNDFGLAAWGVMDVELWYSRWQTQPNGIAYPTQIDVRRVGRPYKRMTVLAADFAPTAPADSFAVSDSLRTAFVATARHAMHDIPLDSARLVEPRLAWFGTPGTPAGAVKLGKRWVLLEAGLAPLNTARVASWLDGPIAATLVATATPTQGGITWLLDHHVPLYIGPGATAFVSAIAHGAPTPAPLGRGRWLTVDGDSLWTEPIDLPDAPGTLLAWVPSLQWIYCGPAVSPLQRQYVLARAKERGWDVTRLGTLRTISSPVVAETAVR